MGRRRRNVYIFAPKRKTHPFRNLMLWLLTLMFLACIAVFILNLASNNQVEYLTQRVTVENLPGDLESFSILHLSDLHAAAAGARWVCAEKGDYAEERFLHCSVWGYGGGERRCGPLAAAAGHDAPDVSVYLIAGDSDPPPLNPAAHGSISPYADWLQAAVEHGAIYLDEPQSQVRGDSTLWLIPEYLYSLDLDATEAAYAAQRDALRGEELILTADQAAQLPGGGVSAGENCQHSGEADADHGG